MVGYGESHMREDMRELRVAASMLFTLDTPWYVDSQLGVVSESNGEIYDDALDAMRAVLVGSAY